MDLFTSRRSGVEYLEKVYKLEEELDDKLEDELDSLDPFLSEFQESAIVYIAGYVQKKLFNKVQRCKVCLDIVNSRDSLNFRKSLIELKDKG